MKRRFQPGWQETVGGVTYRVVLGRKMSRVPDAVDLKLEAWTPRGWQAVPMAVGALMADFFYENEEVLYPPSAGFQGGTYYVTYLNQAVSDGWEVADERLQAEKRAREQRDNVLRLVADTPDEEEELDRIFDEVWKRLHDGAS